jgi:hypothetical protein
MGWPMVIEKARSSKNARATKINAPTVINLLELIWLSTSDNKCAKNVFIVCFYHTYLVFDKFCKLILNKFSLYFLNSSRLSINLILSL